jgi:glucose/arabinose dehydrogenase
LAAIVFLALIAASCSDTADTAATPTIAASDSRPAPPVGPGTTSPAPASTAAPVSTPPAATLQGLDVDVIARGLDKPVFVDAPAGDERLFIVQQDGQILILVNGEVEAEPFLDIDELVGSGNLEQGLLGLAFHPAYADNGRFFVYYTDNEGDSRLVEYSVSDDADRADPDSARLILGQEQPAANHNAGMLAFGPDGYLYVAFGDGGGANDQFGNGQRTDTFLGAILRLDVDSAEPYAVPPDNPFVDGGGAPEVWAYGLRNPWRFSFDGDHIYIGDVGQDRLEEVDVIEVGAAGANFGWPIFEGTSCGSQCDGDFVAPVTEYGHAEGCSIIGGYVYRGGAIPEIDGSYFYSDWCGGFLRSFRLEDGIAVEETDWTGDVGTLGQVVGMGTDSAGELYLVTADGFLYELVAVR